LNIVKAINYDQPVKTIRIARGIFNLDRDILLCMADINSRIQKYVGQTTGNEALLEMLDADAATEMLQWAAATVTALVKKTEGMDDATAEQTLEPQLKAVRQALRSGGNWAAGKYADPESRVSLQAKLIEYRSVIFGEPAKLLPNTALASMLNQENDEGKSPLQLVQSFKRIME
jgi:hypothetical protein